MAIQLLTDDEPLVREFVSEALEGAGYTVLLASDGEEAVQIFKEHADEIDLVLLDVMMPKMDGITARQEILRIKPDTLALLISGFSEDSVHNEVLNSESVEFLQKPFEINSLLRKVHKVMNKAP